MNKLLPIIGTVTLLALTGAGTARAQVTDAVKADIPFAFTVGKITLPAGQYIIRPVDSPLEKFMTISDTKGKYLGVFSYEDAQAKEEPRQAELIFEHVGDRYFLYEVFDPANPLGAEIPKSHTERRLEKQMAVNMTTAGNTVTVLAVNADSQR